MKPFYRLTYAFHQSKNNAFHAVNPHCLRQLAKDLARAGFAACAAMPVTTPREASDTAGDR